MNRQIVKCVHCSFGRFMSSLLFVVAFACPEAALAADRVAPGVIDIPRLDNIKIDGDDSDWGTKGFKVNILCDEEGHALPSSVFDPKLELGWDSKGLLVLARVTVKSVREEDYVRHLFKGDSVEVFFAPERGSADGYQLVVSPGLDPKYGRPRHCFFGDPSKQTVLDLTVDYKVRQTASGYNLEMRLPWENCHIIPKIGTCVAFQFYAMHTAQEGEAFAAVWYPRHDSHVNSFSMNTLRLAGVASPAQSAVIFQRDDADAFGDEGDLIVPEVIATPDLAGREILISADGRVLQKGVLSLDSGGHATFKGMARRQPGAISTKYEVSIAGVGSKSIQLKSAQDRIFDAIRSIDPVFKPCVFVGKTFPQLVWNGAAEQKSRLGPGSVRVTFYNAEFRVVSQADVPGRYGAVVDATLESGLQIRRFRTLVRLPERLDGWSSSQGVNTLLAMWAQDARIEQMNSQSYGGLMSLSWLKGEGSLEDTDTAAFVAGLLESMIGGQPVKEIWVRDRQWWIQLKRKLYGIKSTFASAQDVLSAGKESDSVLKSGTPSEAGMDPSIIARIDEICRAETNQQSSEPVALCIARHGVIFFNKAYGKLVDGAPMRIDTAASQGSITKVLGGLTLMMLVDRGLVALDDPIGRVLPPFRAGNQGSTLRIRDLYTHLSGLDGNWGARWNDLEEAVAAHQPFLNIGQFRYNETGFNVGAKIVEDLTGEALPSFANRNLFAPLRIEHTLLPFAGGRVITTAEDYAVIGELLLGKGAIGKVRILKSSTVEAMLPSDRNTFSGIGLMRLGRWGLSSEAYGHLSNNSSILAVDPDRDLVIVIMSAGGRRKTFADCCPKLFETILSGVVEEPANKLMEAARQAVGNDDLKAFNLMQRAKAVDTQGEFTNEIRKYEENQEFMATVNAARGEKDSDAMLATAAALAAAGQLDQARLALQDVVGKYPGTPRAAEAQRMLQGLPQHEP